MKNQPVIFAVGGLVVGVFVGVALGGSMVSNRISAVVSDAMERAQDSAGEDSAATEEAVATLGDRIAALESRLSDNAAATSEVSETVRAQLGEMQESLSAQIGAVGESADEGTADLRAALDEMRSRMREGMGAGMMGAATEAPPADAEAGSTTAESAPSEAEGADMSVGVGETAIFADGSVRAFVSRLNAEDGMARISVNGALASLSVGDAAKASHDGAECSVTLTAVNASAATLSSDCGGGSGDAAAADVPAAPEDGFRPGQTVQLADGLRVFVSGLADDRGSARIAINGLDTQTIAAGESIEVSASDRSCTVTVTGVGDGVVGLEGNCG